jgi:hypothetical protein
MEEDIEAATLARSAERKREEEIALRIVVNFDDMALSAQLHYVSNVLSSHVINYREEPVGGYTHVDDNHAPLHVPIELQVAEKLLTRVIDLIRNCPSICNLTESTVSRFEQLQSHRPGKVIPRPTASDGPSQ